MSQQLLQFAGPLLQGFLALALVLAAILLIKVDRKLSALRSGQDGMARTAAELAQACASAEAAVRALKTGEIEAREGLDARLEEARKLAETLKFLSTTARALNTEAESAAARLPWKDRQSSELPARPAQAEVPLSALPRSSRTRDYDEAAGRNWGGLR